MKPPLSRDLIEQPQLWRLALMLRPDSIDVAAFRTTGDSEVITAHIPLSSLADLEEAVYANSLLLAPFSKVDIVIDTPDYYIIPESVANDASALEAWFKMAGDRAERETVITSAADGRNHVAFTLPHAVAGFISRTFSDASLHHSLSVLARYYTNKSRLGNTGKVYVNLTATRAETAIFDNMGLASLASYECEATDDAVYYILAAARTAGIDLAHDEFLLSGDSSRRTAITTGLRRFASYVMPAVFPAAMHHTAGSDIPFQLIVLKLCE